MNISVFNALREDGNFIVHFVREARTALHCQMDDLQAMWDGHKKGGSNYHELSGALLFEQDVIELMQLMAKAQGAIDEALDGLTCGCDSCGEARLVAEAVREFGSQFEQ